MEGTRTRTRRTRRRTQTPTFRAPRRIVVFWRTLLRARDSLFLNSLPLLINLVAASLWWYSIPLLSGGIDNFSLYWFRNAAPDDGLVFTYEVYKQKTQLLGYAVASVLLLGRIREFLRFIKWELSLSLLLVALLATALFSDYPSKVFTNCLHLGFGFVSIWLFCRHPRVMQSPARAAYRVVLIPLIALQIANLLIWAAHPSASWSDWSGEGRMGGLAGNPNTLGAICVVCVWGLVGLMSQSSPKSKIWWAHLAMLVVVAFNLAGTGSATALTLSIFVGLAMVANLAYRAMNAQTRIVMIMSVATIALGMISYLLTQQTGSEVTTAATSAVGKDVTLTGRVDLWEVGISAFQDRPFFGWGFDAHQSVFEDPRFDIGHNHYHNGYIDTLVNGGIFLAIFILLVFKRFASRWLMLVKARPDMFMMAVLVAVGIVHNLTEYSIFRPNITFWSAWTLAVMTVAVAASPDVNYGETSGRRPRLRASGNSRRKKKSASW